MAELFELKQEDLHIYWQAIIERGAADIKRTLKPSWIVPDIYSLLRNQQVTCLLARGHHGRLLGFIIYNRQQRLFSYEPELFVWLAYNLPIREWKPEDDMPGTVRQVWQYLQNVARTQYQTDQITWITKPSRARAFGKRFGWQPSWVTITVRV